MNPHEKIYQNLKENGYGGWGGQRYEERMMHLDKNLTRLLEATALTSGRVLELGSGAGDVSIWFAKQGFDVVGIEVSETAVNWANEKADALDIHFICSSVTADDLLEHDTFDLIVDGNCLHCLFDEDRKAYIQNVHKWLKADGHYYMSSVMALTEGQSAVVGPIERCF